MDRHFLITVSEQKSALFGIRFLSDFFSDKSQIKATLFYSMPRPPAVWENEKNLEADSRQKMQTRQIAATAEAVLEAAKDEGVRLGFSPENIFLKHQAMEFSKVTDIIQEGEKGQYDAVILGRRGLSMLEEAFEESVSKDIFNQTATFPIWFCRSIQPDRKNVLLYLDGSPSSFSMADHVGFILGKENKHRVDILISEEVKEPAAVWEKSKAILLNHGVSNSLICHKDQTSEVGHKRILSEVKKEKYAAVALGRLEQEQGFLTRLFTSPVCSVLFKELEGASLWVCH